MWQQIKNGINYCGAGLLIIGGLAYILGIVDDSMAGTDYKAVGRWLLMFGAVLVGVPRMLKRNPDGTSIMRKDGIGVFLGILVALLLWFAGIALLLGSGFNFSEPAAQFFFWSGLVLTIFAAYITIRILMHVK